MKHWRVIAGILAVAGVVTLGLIAINQKHTAEIAAGEGHSDEAGDDAGHAAPQTPVPAASDPLPAQAETLPPEAPATAPGGTAPLPDTTDATPASPESAAPPAAAAPTTPPAAPN